MSSDVVVQTILEYLNQKYDLFDLKRYNIYNNQIQLVSF